jgi:SAM-dependent methyltransferase
MDDVELRRVATELRRLPAATLQQRLRALVPALSLPERFRLLHQVGLYHHPESLSGAGSTLAETTELRDHLPRLLQVHSVATVLDLPCGDFHWMRHVPIAGSYLGADIVPEIVAANQRSFAAPAREFRVLDATRDPLPEVDLVICRDLLIHLSHQDCMAVLGNVRASGSRLLLTTHFPDREVNPDIISGDFRALNLCAAPFLLPPPLEIIRESSALGEGAFADRSMALWRVRDLPARFAAGSGESRPDPASRGSIAPREPEQPER